MALLPVFKNGIPLAAWEGNAIATELEVLRDRAGAPNLPIELNIFATYIFGLQPYLTTRYIFHLDRYLHYGLYVPYSVNPRDIDFKINNSVALSIHVNAHTATSVMVGNLDLTSLSLPTGKPYSLDLEVTGETGVLMRYAYEFRTTTSAYALPVVLPTFSTGANETQLNALSEDTQYMVDTVARSSSSGLRTGYRYIPSGGGPLVVRYWFRHRSNRIHWKGKVWRGYNANTISGNLVYNGTQIWSFSVTENWEYDTHIDITSLGLSLGTWYECVVTIDKTAWDDYSGWSPYILAEVV